MEVSLGRVTQLADEGLVLMQQEGSAKVLVRLVASQDFFASALKVASSDFFKTAMESKFGIHAQFDAVPKLDSIEMRSGTGEDTVSGLDNYGKIPE
jgi:hypothetical protein